MHLTICVNHSYPHCGGSEKVVQQIAEGMVRNFGYSPVTVLSRSLTEKLTHNGVQYVPCARDSKTFIKQLRKLASDHTLVYSDCFSHWGCLLKNLEVVPGTKSIALVGMNGMLGRSSDFKLFQQKSAQIRIITHSDNYQDYKLCKERGLEPTVVPNGVDLDEFDDISLDFRGVYKVDTPKMIVCVSNFFPGKGQEYLVTVLKRLASHRIDYTAVFISADVNFPFAQFLSGGVQRALKTSKYKSKFLTNIPRDHTIAAIAQADVFAFPSQKEVAPLVILEAMAARTPWVALPVGNIPTLKGGRMVPFPSKDTRGYARYNDQTYRVFADHLNDLLESETLNKQLGDEGRAMVEETYNWESIASQYNEVFHG